MAISLNNLPTQIKTNYGILSGLAPTFPTPFLDMFNSAPMLAGTKSKTIKFSYLIRSPKAAELLIKSGVKGIKKIKDNYWREVELTPGEIVASQSITADELTQLQPGANEVWMVGGEMIPTSNQLAEQKLQLLKDSITTRMNIMCTELINNGIITFSDGENYIDFGIPAAKSKTYSASNGWLKIAREMKVDFLKTYGKNETDFAIGIDIVDRILQDTALHATMFNLGFSNIGQNLSVDDKALIIGTFMGTYMKQMQLSFDANGISIIPGNVVKLIDRSQFRKGYAAIEVINPTTNLPDLWLGDYWTDIEIGTKINASAEIFAKSGFFPIVVDPNAIQTYTITIA